MPSVAYGNTQIEYQIQHNDRLKNTYINVDKNGVIIKTNKSTTETEIKQYIIKKSAWIMKHLSLYKSHSLDMEIVTGARIFYLGKSYYVEVIEEDIEVVSVSFTHSKFKIITPLKSNQIAINKAIDEFYKEKAIKRISHLVKKWTKIMEVQPEHISFRKAEKRWGSCSATNRVSFNYHLMKINSSLIEYVVIHELSHIKHKNHSKEFWSAVKHYLPDYKTKEEQLKGFEKLL